MAAHFCLPCVWFGKFMFPEDRPSPIFTTFSGIINTVGFVWSLAVIGDDTCSSDTKTWMILGVINCLVNIAFAFYIYYRFCQKVKDGSGASEAAYKLFLYDWGVCMYILFMIWLIIWMALAGQKRGDASSDDKCGNHLAAMITIFILYFAIGIFLIIVSLITECCREPSWKRNQSAQQTTTTAPIPARHQAPPQPAYNVTRPGGAQYATGAANNATYAVPVQGGNAPPPALNPNYGQEAQPQQPQQQQQRQGGIGAAITGIFGGGKKNANSNPHQQAPNQHAV